MKRNRLFTAITLAAALAMTSCTQDELVDNNMLPEGMYPLEIASATLSVESSEQPWTRVSESEYGNSSVWDGSETIGVQLGSENTTYQVNADGTLALTGQQLYWQNSQTATIDAWYPATDGTLDLSDQSAGLKYVLKGTGTGNYQSAVTLNFSHALAKVRVTLGGSQAGDVEKVEIYSYTTCTHTQGTVSGTSEDWITMQYVSDKGYYEANVVPGYTISQFRINGTVVDQLDNGGITPAAGKWHEITISVRSSVIPDDAKDITSDISDSGNYYVSGTRKEAITITDGSPTIYLDNASIRVSSGNAINITGGSPTIHVVGENNSVTSSNGTGIYVAVSSTVTVTSTSRDNILTARGGNGGSGIGAGSDTSCGNIEISNVTVKAYGSMENAATSVCYSAGIGGSGRNACGTITIDNAIIYAYGTNDSVAGNMSTPGIGGGLNGDYKGTYDTITIKNNSQVSVQRGSQRSDYIGSGGSTSNPAISPNGIDATIDESSAVTKLN